MIHVLAGLKVTGFPLSFTAAGIARKTKPAPQHTCGFTRQVKSFWSALFTRYKSQHTPSILAQLAASIHEKTKADRLFGHRFREW
jgi:hypothetical protein